MSGRKLYIRTYGCQMNVYDSERMAEAMAPEGYVVTDSAEEADLVLLNTCHIREKAAEKVYSELGRLRPLKEARPEVRIGVAGCVAQAEGEEIRRRAPQVDLVVGPQSYHRLPDLVRRAGWGEAPVDTDFPAESKFDHLPGSRAKAAPSVFVTVQEGCDKFCAFCVVPYTRGSEASRPAARVLAEARDLVSRGAREITLLGQNVNAYHGEGPDGREWGLGQLIRALAEIDGLLRIRYTTSHPNDVEDDLVAAHGDVGTLMPYLHLPVQSGSDRILKAMNRRHTAEDYLRVVDRLRAARPDLVLSSDFIVGFPGETEEDFRATLGLIDSVGFGMAFSFRYSPRPGTPAAEKPQVDAEVADDRLQRLQALLLRHQRHTQDLMVGTTVSVLFDRPGRLAGQITGKAENFFPVHAQGSLEPGECRPVRILRSDSNSLAGQIVA